MLALALRILSSIALCRQEGTECKICSIEIVRCAAFGAILGASPTWCTTKNKIFGVGSQVKMVITCDNAGTPEMSSASD